MSPGANNLFPFTIFWKYIYCSHLFPVSILLSSKNPKLEVIAAEGLTFYTQRLTEHILTLGKGLIPETLKEMYLL